MTAMISFLVLVSSLAAEPTFVVEQITDLPGHHFFGYIGQSGTTPFSGDGRYFLTLQTSFHDRMPTAKDAAEILVIDMHGPGPNRTGFFATDTRAWNFQQGTMFHW